jgi:hypothetical protein
MVVFAFLNGGKERFGKRIVCMYDSSRVLYVEYE